jgi:outer membrane protein assembly factor BamD
MFRKTVLACALVACCAGSGCFGKKTATAKQPAVNSAAPDDVLYKRSLDDIKHGRFDIARLSLQTLINTYPDSEYLADAKLAIADSYYKEGGTTGLTQAIAEYKDFITFFPFLDQAAYAQMQVGMAYYRMMVKPDRDSSEAVNAEAEFQTFVQKYPNSKLEPQAEQRLREVQEVLAEGDFRISRFYYMRGSNRAAAGRLIELVQRYPLYSRADQANWMLGQIYEKSEKKEIAANYYANIVKNYPLSPLAGDAKNRLIAIGAPVPQPDPGAMARMQAEQNTPRPRSNILTKPMGMLKNGPDVTMAAHHGEPNLEPPDEAGESLTPGAMSAGGPGATGGGGAGNSAVVETVTPGTASPAAASSPDATATGATGDAPVGNNGPDSPTQSAPGASDALAGGAIVGGTASGSVGNTTQGSSGATDPAASASAAGAPSSATGAAACPPAAAAPAGSAAATTGAGASDSSSAATSGNCQATTDNSKNESSSKKKKKKLFPF